MKHAMLNFSVLQNTTPMIISSFPLQLIRSAHALCVCLLLLCTAGVKAQVQPRIFEAPPAAGGPDTVFYPYYNDVQMIEIDYQPSWERICYAIEWSHMHMSQMPRFPDPPVNVYLFRSRSGEIIKAFNTTSSLQELTAAFRAVPAGRRSERIRYATSHRAPRKPAAFEAFRNTVNTGSSDSDFRGYYRICNEAALKYGAPQLYFNYNRIPADACVGMIDSLGNIFLETKYKAIIPVNDHLLVATDTVCGVMSKQRKTIVPFVYDRYSLLNATEVIFMNDQKIGAIYTLATGVATYIDNFDFIDFGQRQTLCDSRKENPDSWLIQFRKNGKTGLLDTNYNIVVPAIYDMISPRYSEQRVVCCRDRKFGYLDSNGVEVIPCVFTYAEYFRKGAGVVQYDGKFQNVDRNGMILPSLIAEHETWRNDQYSYNHNVGRLKAICAISGYGLARGREEVFVVPPIYEEISPLRSVRYGQHRVSDAAFIAKQHGKMGILDTAGHTLIPLVYESIENYTDGNGFRVSRYEIVVPCLYPLIQLGYQNEEFFRVWVNGKSGTMDTTGKWIVPPLYTEMTLFIHGRARAKKDSLYGFLDDHGNTLIPFAFEEVYGEFYNGLAGFRRNGKWGFIDTTGKVVIEPKYDEIRRFESSITGVKLNGKWGFINRKGKLVVDYQYDAVGHEWYDDGTVEVGRNGKIGYIDERGKEVIPLEYTKSWGFSSGLGHYLEKDGMKRYVKK
jgi:hypothetical protein